MSDDVVISDFVSEDRQRELMRLADKGFGAVAIRQAIREAVRAARSGVPAPATASWEP